MAKFKPRRAKQKEAAAPSRGPYEFHGGAWKFLHSQEPEIVLSGPAGSGKSICALMKLHFICDRVPNVRALIARKTRESLTESGLVTLETKVMPEEHPAIRKGGQRRMRQSYRYPNGSEIVLGGLDNAVKIMSTEYDLIFVQESTEIKEADWEALITRLRNNVLPYQQIMADCNPDSPTHWLHRRSYREGQQRLECHKTLMFESRHEDNPSLYDRKLGRWTENGAKYIAKLDALTGARKERLRYGRWVQAEGVVYPEFDRDTHVLQVHEMPWNGHPYPPPDWPRYWGIDFGWANPFVWLCFAADHDGRLYAYREVYRTNLMVEDHAKRIVRLWRDEAEYWSRLQKIPKEMSQKQIAPRLVVCDHDAEDRATFERHTGLSTTGARKNPVKAGIQAVGERLRAAGDGRPRLFLLAGMTDGVDGLLEDAKRPLCTEQELSAYTWDPKRDEPFKENDHGCFVAGTLVITDAGWRPIEDIRPGDRVLTRAGFREVLAAAMTDPAAEVEALTFTDGMMRLTGTANHPVFSPRQGRFVPLGDLMPGGTALGAGGGEVRIMSRTRAFTRQPVYNITVEGEHEYYANGILVSNCDVLRYVVRHLDLGLLWEAPQPVDSAPNRENPGVTPVVGPDGRPSRQGSAVNPDPRLRWGESMPAGRRGGRLFGGSGA